VPAWWVYRRGLTRARWPARRRAPAHRALAKASAAAVVATDSEQAWTDSITVREAIVRLPARQRAAIVLRYHADLSVDDTAAVMRCAPGTVKALTHQALARLRAELGADDPAARA
jgi:RNA polymerase sigma factor (sigma-70 family)